MVHKYTLTIESKTNESFLNFHMLKSKTEEGMRKESADIFDQYEDKDIFGTLEMITPGGELVIDLMTK